jgi:hypothetical protein
MRIRSGLFPIGRLLLVIVAVWPLAACRKPQDSGTGGSPDRLGASGPVPAPSRFRSAAHRLLVVSSAFYTRMAGFLKALSLYTSSWAADSRGCNALARIIDEMGMDGPDGIWWLHAGARRRDVMSRLSATQPLLLPIPTLTRC